VSAASPPPWSAEVTPNCFIVRDANGQALSYVYYESEPGRRSAAKLLSKDEARRITRISPSCRAPFPSGSLILVKVILLEGRKIRMAAASITPCLKNLQKCAAILCQPLR
jgi:hypothetical protein